jgi:transposase
VKAQAAGKLGTADKGRPITPEQMEISRLRAEVIRLRMETEILKKAAAYFARESL